MLLSAALPALLVFFVSLSHHIPSIAGAPLKNAPSAGSNDDKTALYELILTFQAMDANKDEALVLPEIKAAEQKVIACIVNNAKRGVPTNEFKVLDANRNGKLDKGEFASDKSKKSAGQSSSPALMAAFAVLDKNKDGQLTPSEFDLVMFAQTMEASKLVDQDFKQADLNKDGKLTFAEVLELFGAIGNGKVDSTNAVALAFGKMMTQCLDV